MASKIWVVLQQREGQLHRMSREAVAAGRRLAAATGDGAVEAVLLGSGMGDLAAEVAGFDVAAVHVGDAEALAHYTPGAYLAALTPAIREAAPDFVVFPHTYQSVDYFPRLACRLGAALLPEVVAFRREGGELRFRRPILAGKMEAEVKLRGEGPVLLSVQSGAFPGDEVGGGRAEVGGGRAEVRGLALGEDVRPDREILGVEEVGGDQVDLPKAEVIVAVGRGVGGEDKMGPVTELARELGAEIGASRPVIDNGWLPRDRQIGSSGHTVAPKLYLAVGISGAIQHLVGMKGSSTVVAINKDPNAPIFTVADYGIVGDLHEVVPALLEALREARA